VSRGLQALVLAAGYATRLRPLTDTIAKPLLPVGGRPILDWIVDKIEEVPDVDGLHVVTNARYAPSFEAWAGGRGVTIHDDGTTSNDDRLGAIGDIGFVLERIGTDNDLLAVAGDNLFDYSLADYADWWRGKGVGSAVAVYDVGDKELIKQYGVVALDENERVIEFVEKPTDPPSTLAATATYLYHSEHLPLVARYLGDGNPPDQPGNLVAWLHTREPVYGYAFEGGWYDIGNPQQLLEADNRLRELAGLPARGAYRPD
jgi:glucose-1-phosphate thymidylyltransferase